MKTGIVIDSACDVTPSFIAARAIRILPISLRFGSESFMDVRDPEATQAFYQKYLNEKTLDAETQPFSVEQIRELFLDELVLKYDRVLVLTISKNRSQIFNNATEAAFAILNGYRERRKTAGVSGGFSLKVMDTQTLFTGQAVLLEDAVRLLESDPDMPFSQLRHRVDDLSQRVYAYLVPRDLFYLKHRASRRGERTVGGLSYHIGSWLDIKPVIQAHRGETTPVAKERGFDRALERLFERARQAVETGLATGYVAMSYAGPLHEMESDARYDAFCALCTRHGVHTSLAVMSTTAGLNVGPGAFSLAYAAG